MATSTKFDPYHKWFGIPPSQQPPTHYRLLGLEPLEPDREVIDSAANQRIAYLQDIAAGPHGEVSQKLLNEVAAARQLAQSESEKGIRRSTAEQNCRQARHRAGSPSPATNSPSSREKRSSSLSTTMTIRRPDATSRRSRQRRTQRTIWQCGGSSARRPSRSLRLGEL